MKTPAQNRIAEQMTALGYEDISTGGGCWAWHKPLADGTYILICTVDQGLYARTDHRVWMVGRHAQGGGEELQFRQSLTLSVALTEAAHMSATVSRVEREAREHADYVKERYGLGSGLARCRRAVHEYRKGRVPKWLTRAIEILEVGQ